MRVPSVVRASASAVERAGRQVWRRRVLARGIDVTSAVAARSCLVLAPHPDDETLGCGATIARKRAAGTPVRVLVAADGRSSHHSAIISPDELAALRSAEMLDACAALGVAAGDVEQLGFEDESLAGHLPEIAAAIGAQLDAFEPQEVRLPSGHDWHPDHGALRAALDLALRGRVRPPRVLEHPVWLWVHGPWDADPGGPWAPRRPVGFVRGYLRRGAWARAELVRTHGFLGRKRQALLAHRSQTSNLTGEEDWQLFDDAFIADFLLPVEIAVPSVPAPGAT